MLKYNDICIKKYDFTDKFIYISILKKNNNIIM